MSLQHPSSQAAPEEQPRLAAPVSLDQRTLDRLMAEVRNGATTEAGRYNRMHNRHNRS